MDKVDDDLFFVVFGDPQNVNQTCKKIVDRVVSERPDFCIIVGDLVNNADDLDQWSRITELVRPLKEVCPLYCVPGNHDYQSDGSRKNFLDFAHSPEGKTYFSFERKGIRFLFLDSGLDTSEQGDVGEGGWKKFEKGGCDLEGEQYRWLQDNLERAEKEDKKVFLFHHHPIFLPTNVYFSTSPTIRVDETVSPHTLGNLLPLLVRYPPEIMFSGHLHTYEHCVYACIDFITTGATSFDLWKMEGTVNLYRVKAEERYHYCRVGISAGEINLEAVDEDGRVFDSWKRPI